MEIAGLTAAQHAEFLDLVNAEIRPPHATTCAWDDFPLALDRANLPWQLGATAPDGSLAGGLACLVREFQTSCGTIAIAGIGSVVTTARHRGQGLSSLLQQAAVDHLRRRNVPLAVLWTDRPEIYAGRGFVPAGFEWHADLEGASLPDRLPDGLNLRPYGDGDAVAVSALYRRHRWFTRRQPGEAARLYGMPGTRGLVAVDGTAEVRAAVFAGKGADFHEFVPEWSGPTAIVVPLLAAVRARGLAGSLLVPQGCDELAGVLRSAGARLAPQASGCWSVLLPEAVAARVAAEGGTLGGDPADPRVLLGSVGADGNVEPGCLAVAVWGFDSV